jgi:glycosyltransferase involved in cell wall biosynthesis
VAFLLPTLGGGGAEKAAIALASEFAGRGLRLDFVLMRAIGHFLDQVPAGASVFDLKVDRARWVLGPLVKYLRERRPRSVLSFMWPLNSAIVIAERIAMTGARLILTEHTDWAVNPLAGTALTRARLGATMRLTYPRAAKIVAVSNGSAGSVARAAGMPQSSIEVIYNPITPLSSAGEPDPELMAKWLPDDTVPGLLAVGRFHAQKDYPTLLRALSIVRRSSPARLLILGEGPLFGEISALRSELGLEDAVLMPGFKSNPYAYMERADLFVLSSRYEALPTVVIEALACGAPVVSTDCRSGPREILKDGALGELAPVGDAEALAAAILAALARSHDKQQLIDRSNDFSTTKAAQRYLGLLLPDYDRPPIP